MKYKTRKIMFAALSLTMAASIAASQIITFAKESGNGSGLASGRVEEVSFNNLTDSIDLSNVVRDNLSNQVMDYGEQEEIRNITGQSVIKTVMIGLDTPSVAESAGGEYSVAEYLDTKDGQKALKNVNDSQNRLLSDLGAAGISYRVVSRYSAVLNAVAIEVNTSQFAKIKKLPGVSMAGLSKTYAAPKVVENAQTNPNTVYGTGIYDSTEFLGKYDGSRVTVAILDTGIDYTHEAFSYEPEETKFDEDYISERLAGLAAASRTPGINVDDVYLSKKIPFAYDYSDNDTDVYPSYSQHGVHVAGIVAGKAKTYVNKDGYEVDTEAEYDFLGVAPEAQLVVCKVFTDDLDSDDLGGATSEDVVAALDDCVKLGVDIINMSLGTTSGFGNVWIEGDQEGQMLYTCYENIKEQGISLIAAAGNEYSSGFGSEFGTNLASNPDSGTVGSPSTFMGAMSVASINGQTAPYLEANPGEDSAYGDSPIYYNESSDANSVPYDFAEEMLGAGKSSATFKYIVIPGTGSKGDYSASVQRQLKPKSLGGLKEDGEKIIVVVKRGTLDFQTKVENAQSMYADGIIIYNNVPGTVRMSLQDIKEERRIPAISVDMDAGALLTTDPANPYRLRSEGTIKIDLANQAGPFMNDYSSWGATPDLKLKPDITAHGGEITSAVSGGYEEMSGTSMATPNLAGLMALVKNYLRDKHEDIASNPNLLTRLTNQIVMSTATLLYDEQKLPYSPRKQGAGLATLSNIFNTKAYLATDEQNGGTEDNRPKIELGEDEAKNGVYSFTFTATNFGEQSLQFKLVSRFFTETLASNKLAVAEAAYMLDDIPAVFTVNGNGVTRDGDIITIGGGKTATIDVTLRLSADEKAYLDASFVNGMFIEGFISLESQDGTGTQCDLNLPFMGFYGDWESAPMMDYNAYQISEIQQDTSLNDSEKPHESVYATQLFSTYYNGRYAIPMGGYVYLQDEDADYQVYVNEEHCSISRFNIYNGATATDNYMTSTGIRALYAGLLRNAEVVTYDIYDVNTGEIVYQGEKYRIGKAYAGGGSAHPALVDLKLDPDTLGLVNNGKYCIEFNFYMKEEEKGTEVSYDNNFTSTFYVDYDAPILQSSRIVYRDKKDASGKITQEVFLELDIYDNHYPQAVLLCYSDAEHKEGDTGFEINLATEYVTPVQNPKRNTTNTVSIEITDIYETYRNRLYVQIDDYALNHTVYGINFNSTNNSPAEDGFSFVTDDKLTLTQGTSATDYRYNLTIKKNEVYRVELKDCGNANASNYTWSSTADGLFIRIKGNEIFGLEAGNATVTVDSGNRKLILNVKVEDDALTLANPTLGFGLIKDNNLALVKARGTVEVNAGQTFDLTVEADPWYYPIKDLVFTWSSDNEEIATVDQNGKVTTNSKKRGYAEITAKTTLPNGTTLSAVVTLSVQEPFRISSMTLTKYYGAEEIVIIPNDKNVMYIGEEAFEDNNTMRVVVIPRTVVEISERAFLNCTALEEVYFINGPTLDLCPEDETTYPVVKKSSLNLILRDAFQGCTNLKYIDLTNTKVITVGASAFEGCENLAEITAMENIGIADNFAFKGTELKEVNITGLHTAGYNVFEDCKELETIVTGHYTALGEGMFYGCTKLEEVTINNPRVNGSERLWDMIGGGAFENCTSLATVNFGDDGTSTRANTVFKIDSYAFAGCEKLATVNFGDYSVSYIGDYAFKGTAITEFTMPKGNPELGNNIFGGKSVSIIWDNDDGAANGTYGGIYRGTTFVLAPAEITSDFRIAPNTTEIAPYAFASSKLVGVTALTVPESVEIIGEGAFYGTDFTSIVLPTGLTAIPAYAFAYSSITSITIPAPVEIIGEGAFMGSDLATLNFAAGPQLAEICDYAFSGTKLTVVNTLPDSVKTMGSYVFGACENLTEINLPSLEYLGSYTFIDCPNLATVKFGSSAQASGNYTFFPGSHIEIQDNKIVEVFHKSSLVSVDLGGLTELGEGVFWHCSELTSIDLKDVTVIGIGTFTACNLSSVTGLENVTSIGELAFAENRNLATLNLTNAVTIGAQAFYNVDATTLTVPKAESIGRQAFAGIAINKLEIPATLKELGDGAFMSAGNLAEITVESGNPVFFVRDNVLYRIINSSNNGGEETYELCLYPAGKVAGAGEGYNSHYRVIDGTVAIQGWAFAYVYQRALATVTLPYSLKTIGAYAFYNNEAGVSRRFNFESIAAPTLLSEYYDISQIDPSNLYLSLFRSLYYANFGYEIVYFSTEAGFTEDSKTIIAYPSNGTGYDNYVYSLYFGSKITLGELMDEDTRKFISLVDSFDIDEVNSWLELDPENEEYAKMVEEFSADVKEAHRIYNGIMSAKQLEYIGEDRVAKLFAVEDALKPVKKLFGITVKVSSVEVDESSKHKSQYTVGDRFDMTGLVLKVTYDDHSSEVITDISNVILSPAYSGPLYSYSTYVTLEYNDILFRVFITVSEKKDSDNDNKDDDKDKDKDNHEGGSGCAGCGGMDINSTLGGTGLVLMTIAGAMFVMHKLRRKANK